MHQRHGANLMRGATLALAVALTASVMMRAAAPSSAMLGGSSGPAAWDGFSALAAASPDGEATCVEGTNCDTFTLKLAAGDYRGKRVRYKAAWTNQLNDFDVYVHQGPADGPVLSPANGGPPSTPAKGTFYGNTDVTPGANATYTIHDVYYALVA